MSTTSEQRYVDLKKICDRVSPELFETLSWILLLNLDLVPEEDIEANPNMKFSYDLMNKKYDKAMEIAKSFADKNKPISSHYKDLLRLDPKLEKTIEIADTFFALAKRRKELQEKLGIKGI